MGNPFSTAARVILDAVDSLASVPLIYRRGSLEIRITAVPGTTLAQTTDTDGLALRVRKGDWLVNRELIDFGDGPTEPEAGDQLIDPCDGTRWEAGSPGAGVPPWAWSDRERTRFRIHVEEITADG